jgi:hypothetical protein
MSPITELIGGAKAYGWGSFAPIPIVPSFESIETITVASGTSNEISFTSIPSTYNHLQIRLIARTNRASNDEANLLIRFNNDTGSNYAYHDLYGDGASVTASAAASQTKIIANRLTGASAVANIFGGIIIDILDYKNTNKYKTVRAFGGVDRNSAGGISFSSGLWMNTNAITEIDFTTIEGSFDFTQYSHFALYGIKGA